MFHRSHQSKQNTIAHRKVKFIVVFKFNKYSLNHIVSKNKKPMVCVDVFISQNNNIAHR